MRRASLALLVACCVCLSPFTAWAQSEGESGGPVSRVYLSQVKTGQTAAWVEAAKVHTQWHRDHDDTFAWIGFYVETGEDTGKYGWATANHSWSDFDDYDSSLEAADGEHYAATAGMYTESSQSWFSVAMPQMSNPAPPGTLFPFYQVIDYHIAGGQQGAFIAAVTAVHEALQAGGWEGHYGWSSRVDGEGPVYTLLIPLENWAALTPPERPFPAVLAEQVGQERADELLSTVGSATLKTTSRIIRILPELTSIPGQ